MSDGYIGISASSVGAVIDCPTRMAFPKARTNGVAAKRGNVLHSFCRNVTVNPECRETHLSDISDEKIRATASKINLGAALEGLQIVACERAYVLNVQTRLVRVAGDNIDRKYNEALVAKGLEPLGKYDVPCTIDVVAMADGVPVELDYKSGQSIGPIKEHWQRRICATALMIVYETSTAISRVAYIGEDGGIRPDGDEFSCMDIDDFCDEIASAIDKAHAAKALFAAGVMPDVYPSDEACKYCEALTSCPHWTSFARSMLGEIFQIPKDLSELSPEQMGKAFELMKNAQRVLKNIEDAGKLMMTTGSLPIDDKYEYKQSWYKGRAYFNDARARGEITKLMLASGADQEEIDAKLASLMGTGKEYAKHTKVKRSLDVLN